MRDENKALHSQVILQSLQYTECNEVAVGGKFVPESGHNLACHVHPVVAALFLPKIDQLEQHFLYSNLANIVASRYNQESFKTRPDYELFYNLVTDPNDVVCDSRSPLKDLKNRCHLQKQLWQSVLGLRNGQYYNCDQLDLMRAIDMCRLNKYDTPDLVYGRYDGTVVKRLFAAFSFRPTLVLSVPTPQVFSHNPYFQSANPVVSTISMINLRLPQYSQQYLNTSLPAVGGVTSSTSVASTANIRLSEALQQSQLFFENGSLVMKNTQVIDSRGVLVFFVDRRKHNLDLTQYNDPLAMVALPNAISGFERVNQMKVSVDAITLDDQVGSSGVSKSTWNLKSVVCAKTLNAPAGTSGADKDKNQDLFIGSETYVSGCAVASVAPAGTTGVAGVMKYDPMSATSTNQPMTIATSGVIRSLDETVDGKSRSVIEHRGMIFVFTK
jgi:hypothetical protein